MATLESTPPRFNRLGKLGAWYPTPMHRKDGSMMSAQQRQRYISTKATWAVGPTASGQSSGGTENRVETNWFELYLGE